MLLTDRPRDAKWLTPAERDHLEGVLAEEARAKESVQKFTVGQALRTRNVWLLALGIFATNTGGYALTFWMPTTVKNISGGSDRLRALVQRPVLPLRSRGRPLLRLRCGSHRQPQMDLHRRPMGHRNVPRDERNSRSVVSHDHDLADPDGSDGALWPPPFWALPTLTLTHAAAAASIGFINIFANLAGYFGNHLIGWIKDRGASDSTCLFFLAGWYLLGGVIISLVQTRPQAEPAALRAATD